MVDSVVSTVWKIIKLPYNNNEIIKQKFWVRKGYLKWEKKN